MRIFLYTLLLIIAFALGSTAVHFKYQGWLHRGDDNAEDQEPENEGGIDIYNKMSKGLEAKLGERDQLKREIDAKMLALADAVAGNALAEAEQIAQVLYKLRVKLAELKQDIEARRSDLELQQSVLGTGAEGVSISTPSNDPSDADNDDVVVDPIGAGDRPLDLLRRDMEATEQKAAVDAIIAEEQARQDALRRAEEIEFLQETMDELNMENDRLREQLTGAQGRVSRISDEHAATLEELRDAAAKAQAYRAECEQLANHNASMLKDLEQKTMQSADLAERNAALDTQMAKVENQRKLLAAEGRALRFRLDEVSADTAKRVQAAYGQKRDEVGDLFHRSNERIERIERRLALAEATGKALEEQLSIHPNDPRPDQPVIQHVELTLNRNEIQYNHNHRRSGGFSEIRLTGVSPNAVSIRGPGGTRPDDAFIENEQLIVRFDGQIGFAIIAADREPSSIVFK